MADLLVLPRPAESLQNGADFSGKTCNTLGLPKRKEWPQCHKEQLARMPEPPLPKEKNRATCPDHQIVKRERVKMSESCTLIREKGIREGAWRGKVDSTVKEDRF